MYDIFFISYGEPNAEDNWLRVKSRFPHAKRIKDVKGIHQAHMLAAKRSFTPMFWVVDGDAEVLDTFNFDYKVWEGDYDIVHVWRSQNPVNGMLYGYGGVKLLPKQLTLNMNTDTLDMTLGISKKFKAMDEVSNTTAFNTDPFSTWRSAFRECCKLSLKEDAEASKRLTGWKSIGDEVCRAGATAGELWGTLNKNNPLELLKINDYEWLREQYEKDI